MTLPPQSERVLSFVPPDGRFRLISYQIGSQQYVHQGWGRVRRGFSRVRRLGGGGGWVREEEVERRGGGGGGGGGVGRGERGWREVRRERRRFGREVLVGEEGGGHSQANHLLSPTWLSHCQCMEGEGGVGKGRGVGSKGRRSLMNQLVLLSSMVALPVYVTPQFTFAEGTGKFTLKLGPKQTMGKVVGSAPSCIHVHSLRWS